MTGSKVDSRLQPILVKLLKKQGRILDKISGFGVLIKSSTTTQKKG